MQIETILKMFLSMLIVYKISLKFKNISQFYYEILPGILDENVKRDFHNKIYLIKENCN